MKHGGYSQGMPITEEALTKLIKTKQCRGENFFRFHIHNIQLLLSRRDAEYTCIQNIDGCPAPLLGSFQAQTSIGLNLRHRQLVLAQLTRFSHGQPVASCSFSFFVLFSCSAAGFVPVPGSEFDWARCSLSTTGLCHN